ncbi:hypothetical protein K2X85_20840 [bacterium]|nr:hypothetical protein [bacterium]
MSISSEKLVMTLKGVKEGKEHTHVINSTVTMTLDGKPCKIDDLAPGTKIRVTSKNGDTKIATNVEAIKNHATFVDTHEGIFVSGTSSKLMMTNKDGKKGEVHSHSLLSETKMTLDGKACKAEDLKAGMKIRLTTKRLNKEAAIEVEALNKNSDFA